MTGAAVRFVTVGGNPKAGSRTLTELGATVPTPGLAVLESDLGRLDAVLQPWVSRVASLLKDSLAQASRTGLP
jgi:hypothetical protein